jgi:hypothetical protein
MILDVIGPSYPLVVPVKDFDLKMLPIASYIVTASTLDGTRVFVIFDQNAHEEFIAHVHHGPRREPTGAR